VIPFKDNLLFIARPTATTGIIILNCLCFVVEAVLQKGGDYTAGLLGSYGMFVPSNFTAAFASAEPLAMVLAVCSVFTAMFLHGGVMHILGNMVFLSCFGRAVEARLGKKQFVMFYLLAGLAATAGQYLLNPLSDVPNLGASGAIAGVLSAYMILWPKAKIVGASMELGVLYVPAWSFLFFWCASQVTSILFEHPHGGGGVAFMAHLSGFAFGALAGLLVKWLTPVGQVRYPSLTSSDR
jgi:membrane associated rhomboid family serine protease